MSKRQSAVQNIIDMLEELQQKQPDNHSLPALISFCKIQKEWETLNTETAFNEGKNVERSIGQNLSAEDYYTQNYEDK